MPCNRRSIPSSSRPTCARRTSSTRPSQTDASGGCTYASKRAGQTSWKAKSPQSWQQQLRARSQLSSCGKLAATSRKRRYARRSSSRKTAQPPGQGERVMALCSMRRHSSSGKRSSSSGGTCVLTAGAGAGAGTGAELGATTRIGSPAAAEPRVGVEWSTRSIRAPISSIATADRPLLEALKNVGVGDVPVKSA